MSDPDFDQIVRDIGVHAGQHPHPDLLPSIAEQLRLVWNARGEADEQAVFDEFGGPTPECLRAAGAIRIRNR